VQWCLHGEVALGKGVSALRGAKKVLGAIPSGIAKLFGIVELLLPGTVITPRQFRDTDLGADFEVKTQTRAKATRRN
jgi:hypothetical protein